MGHEREQNGWLGATLRQVPATAPDGCLDAETLAAWADGGLAANAAAAVEAHASSCARCMAVLAAMERTAPAARARHAWTSGRVFRWVVPLTAGATAVALWIAVPDRSVTPVQPRATRDVEATRERTDADQVLVPEPRMLKQNENPEPAPRTGTQNRTLDPEPSTQNPELRTQKLEPLTASPPSAVAESPSPPPAAPPASSAAPTAKPQSGVATDSLAGTAAARARRGESFSTGMPLESAAPGNAQVRWRVADATSIERSTDGGNTWMKTVPLPRDSVKGLTILGIRVMNDLNAIARMSDGSEFYTSNGGISWIRLQEKSAAPF